MKILVINGVNLNMVGVREPSIYGEKTYAALENYIITEAEKLAIEVEVFQSNYEGAIVEKIQGAYQKFDGIIINAGAYTHTSIAILDALKAVGIKTAEVHLSDIASREDFRKFSYISLMSSYFVCGKGFEGYKDCLEFFKN